MEFIQRYNKFVVAAIAAFVIVTNNGDVVGSVPLIQDISDNLAALLGAFGVVAVPNKK
jgi:hypothetical protein